LADQTYPRPDDHLGGLVAEATITQTERRWFYVMASMLGVMLAVIVLTGFTQMLHPLSDVETVDAKTLHLKGEFVENNLGVANNPDGSVTVRMVAQQYMFVPQCVKVPIETPVHFRLTSADVTHGFFVGQTNTNAMVVPGFVTDVRAKFHRIADLTMPCDEFCGFGHHGMAARVEVVPKAEYASMSPEDRGICGP
jgi:cytochrome c oxidase subunit II